MRTGPLALPHCKPWKCKTGVPLSKALPPFTYCSVLNFRAPYLAS